MTEIDSEVIVAGAGPVGLTAALALARRGMSTILLERETELGTFWRASTFHPPTLDVATDLGIVEPMLQQGLVAPYYQLRDYKTGPVARFNLDAIASQTAWPFRLQLEQYKYSAIVARKLAEYRGAEIRFGTAVTGLVQHDDHVAVRTGDS